MIRFTGGRERAAARRANRRPRQPDRGQLVAGRFGRPGVHRRQDRGRHIVRRHRRDYRRCLRPGPYRPLRRAGRSVHQLEHRRNLGRHARLGVPAVHQQLHRQRSGAGGVGAVCRWFRRHRRGPAPPPHGRRRRLNDQSTAIDHGRGESLARCRFSDGDQRQSTTAQPRSAASRRSPRDGLTATAAAASANSGASETWSE